MFIQSAVLVGSIALVGCQVNPAATTSSINNTTREATRMQLQLTQEWDKVFSQSENVEHRKVTFTNRYGNMH